MPFASILSWSLISMILLMWCLTVIDLCCWTNLIVMIFVVCCLILFTSTLLMNKIIQRIILYFSGFFVPTQLWYPSNIGIIELITTVLWDSLRHVFICLNTSLKISLWIYHILGFLFWNTIIASMLLWLIWLIISQSFLSFQK